MQLFCSVDTHLWTTEGTELVIQEKATRYAKVIESTKAKGKLTKRQEAFVQRREKTLTLLSNPYPRPSRPLYQGEPSILVGVSYGLQKPATLAVVDIQTGKAITYRSIKQLLGENCKLLKRYRHRQSQNAHRRHNNQRKNSFNRFREANLGKHIDHLIAGAIVAIAQEYRASSIVLPDLDNIREIIESKVQVRAEQKILECVEKQRQYALGYRAQVHRWSYARLSKNIQSKAAQIGISVETAKQPHLGSFQEKARNIAIAAYQSRK